MWWGDGKTGVVVGCMDVVGALGRCMDIPKCNFAFVVFVVVGGGGVVIFVGVINVSIFVFTMFFIVVFNYVIVAVDVVDVFVAFYAMVAVVDVIVVNVVFIEVGCEGTRRH